MISCDYSVERQLTEQVFDMWGRDLYCQDHGRIAAQIFGIELAPSAVQAGIDGWFTNGPLRGCSVNVKWYLKREGLLDISEVSIIDYYLVLAGPSSAALSSRGTVRPWCIDAVYLFNAKRLLDQQRARGVQIGTASSVRMSQWDAVEIYPRPVNAE